MQTARVTILMTPEKKAALERQAAKRGVSSGEYVRLALDSFEQFSGEEEVELAALAAELNAAVPRMKAALERSSEILQDLHRENEAFFRERRIN